MSTLCDAVSIEKKNKKVWKQFSKNKDVLRGGYRIPRQLIATLIATCAGVTFICIVLANNRNEPVTFVAE